jgi:hypothetical protein
VTLSGEFTRLPPVELAGWPWELDVLKVGAGHGLGRMSDGSPLLLVRSSDSDELPGFRLSHLTATGGLTAKLRFPDGSQTESQVASVQITGSAVLQDAFLDLVESSVLLRRATVGAKDLQSWLATLSELFAALERPPRTSVLGLWGEMLTIVASGHPTVFVQLWHSVKDAPLDFADGAGRGLEVKTTSRDESIHEFALGQLRGSGDMTYVLSLRSHPDDDGTSIGDMLDGLKVGDAALEMVKRGVISTLGSSWAEGIGVKYSAEAALQSACVYHARSIPAIDPEAVPSAVQRVRFEVDLATVEPLYEGAHAVSHLCRAIGWT